MKQSTDECGERGQKKFGMSGTEQEKIDENVGERR